jgi:hypothetical protein
MVASRKAKPGLLDAAPGVTNRFLYAGAIRSSSDLGAASFFLANQASSTLTQTSPQSIGVSCFSSPGTS